MSAGSFLIGLMLTILQLPQGVFTFPTEFKRSPYLRPRQEPDFNDVNNLCYAWCPYREIWGPDGCRYYSKIPDYNTKIFRWSEGWPGGRAWGALEALDEGTKEIFQLYSQLYKAIAQKPIRIRLVPRLADPSILGETNRYVGEEGCYIRVVLVGPTVSFEGDMKHIVAHELYHCVQGYHPNRKRETSELNQWWVDGGAEYFANKLYPRGPLSEDNAYGLIGQYSPGSSFWRQNYACSIFFLYLGNIGWTETRIDRWLAAVPDSPNEQGVTRFLSQNGPFKNAFPGFAQALYDNKISYSNGAAVRSNYKDEFLEIVWETPTSHQKYRIVSEPFAIELRTVILPKGRKVALRYIPDSTCNGGCVIHYRRIGTNPWLKLTEITIETTCNENNNRYEFLHTTTAAKGAGAVDFTVSEHPTEEETCEQTKTCLEGKWNVDLIPTRDSAKKQTDRLLSSLPLKSDSFEVSGSITYELNSSTRPPNNTLEYKNWRTIHNYHIVSPFDGTPASGQLYTDVLITGEVVSSVTNLGNETFSWSHSQSSGFVRTTSDSGAGAETTEGPFDGAAGADTIRYLCSGDKLELTLGVGRRYEWTIFFNRG